MLNVTSSTVSVDYGISDDNDVSDNSKRNNRYDNEPHTQTVTDNEENDTYMRLL